MIRLIFKISNQGAEGQSIGDSFKTCEIESKEAEKILMSGHSYSFVSLVGCELSENPAGKE